jgi:MFS family permease
MGFIRNFKQEFSFIKGNYAILVLSWILVDFAVELPATYFSLYVLGLGATETILGVIGLSQFLALASLQFPGGYLADKYGRKWLISSMTFGVALSSPDTDLRERTRKKRRIARVFKQNPHN